MSTKKELSFNQKRKLARLRDKPFKRHKKAFDDTTAKTGDFIMPMYWFLIFKYHKMCLAENCFLVGSFDAEVINARVRLGCMSKGKNTVNIESYDFMPVKKGQEYGFDSESFILHFAGEQDAKQAMQLFDASGLNLSFVTPDGSALTVYTTDEVTA